MQDYANEKIGEAASAVHGFIRARSRGNFLPLEVENIAGMTYASLSRWLMSFMDTGYGTRTVPYLSVEELWYINHDRPNPYAGIQESYLDKNGNYVG